MYAFKFAMLLVVTGVLFGAGSACRQAEDVSGLVEVARSGGSLKVRQEACLRLAEVPGDVASDGLIELLADDQLSYCAAHALGERKESRAVVALLEHLARRGPNTDKFVRALGEIGDPSALQALQELRGSIDSTSEYGRRLERELDEAVLKLRHTN